MSSADRPDTSELAGPRGAGPRGTAVPPSGERLFRRRALERYARRDEESVLPRLARPPAFAALWTLVALLAILGGVVGAVPVADERSLPLVVTVDGPRLVVPVDASPEVVVSSGDPLRCLLGGQPRVGRVGTVGEVRLSPAELGERLGVDIARLDLDGPRRLAVVELDGAADPPDFAAFRGAVVEARVTVARPRAATLLPGVGPWIAEWLSDERDEEASP